MEYKFTKMITLAISIFLLTGCFSTIPKEQVIKFNDYYKPTEISKLLNPPDYNIYKVYGVDKYLERLEVYHNYLDIYIQNLKNSREGYKKLYITENKFMLTTSPPEPIAPILTLNMSDEEIQSRLFIYIKELNTYIDELITSINHDIDDFNSSLRVK